jgi:2,4-dienoyl-CoA reductase (NADPH2)
MIDSIGKDIGRTTRWGMLQDLKRTGVISKTATKALEINQMGLKVEKDKMVEDIPADTIVLAIGARPYNPLSEILEKKSIPYRIIGDAQKIGRAFEAIHQGYDAGRNI